MRATFIVDSQYIGGYTGRIRIQNIGSHPIYYWALQFHFKGNITNIWNARLLRVKDDIYCIGYENYNAHIEPKETVEFGFQGMGERNQEVPSRYQWIGEFCEVGADEYTIDVFMKEQWDHGATVRIEISNQGEQPIRGWKLVYSEKASLQEIWDGIRTMHEGDKMEVCAKESNQEIAPKGKVGFEYLVMFDNYVKPSDFKLYRINDSLMNENVKEPKNSGTPAVSSMPVPTNTDNDKKEQSPTPVITGYIDDEIDMTDTDGDGLIDELETIYHTDRNKKDSDGDGLSDYEEIYRTETDPLKVDTDDNGILDPNEDADGDSLSNKEELQINTNPLCSDSDEDGLTDGEEVLYYQTDPLNEDTDEDGILDGDEVLLGLDPRKGDSDGDGIGDGNEKILQTFSEDITVEEKPQLTKVEISCAGTGNLTKTTYVESLYGKDVLSSEVIGLVGTPVEINTSSEFDTATVKFSYDEKELGNTREEDLGILWYNQDQGNYVVVESEVNPEENTVTMKTTHFSCYMLINLPIWLSVWNSIPVYKSGMKNYDIAFVHENTRWEDEVYSGVCSSARALANCAKEGDHICEIEYGQSAWVEFDFGKEEEFSLSENNDEFDAVFESTALINGELNKKGCNISKGLNLAIEKLSGLGGNNEKIIILYASGGGMDDMEDSISQAIEQGIKIYPMFFDSSYSWYLGDYDKLNDEVKTYNREVIGELAASTGGTVIDGTVYDIEEEDGLEELVYDIWDLFSHICYRQDERNIDSDGDGISDAMEKQGIMISNGTLIHTDPYSEDMDGDGLTDGEELNLVECGDNGGCVAYMCSSPVNADSDGDGLFDYEDPSPFSKTNIGKLMKLGSNTLHLMQIQKWLVELGYLNMGDNPYAKSYGGLTRTAVNVYRLNHGFAIRDDMDVNTYARIANDYHNTINQGETGYRISIERVCKCKYVKKVRIIEPQLTTDLANNGVTVVLKDNSTIKDKDAREFSIYLYDYTEPVMKMVIENEIECDEIKKKNRISQYKLYAQLVTNDGPWDIKREKQWNEQLKGIPWCSGKFPFVFQGEIINPEILGNITYGYWGTFIGFSKAELVAGGNVASVLSNLKLDSKEDRKNVKRGIKLYYEINEKN